jgi:hypothetical protein
LCFEWEIQIEYRIQEYSSLTEPYFDVFETLFFYLFFFIVFSLPLFLAWTRVDLSKIRNHYDDIQYSLTTSIKFS